MKNKMSYEEWDENYRGISAWNCDACGKSQEEDENHIVIDLIGHDDFSACLCEECLEDGLKTIRKYRERIKNEKI